jgi:hypothetical protein
MKKLILLCIALCILAIGCQKEGVYNPSKKITRIYEQPNQGSKILTEEWTWDKNLLTKITYPSNYGSYYENYTYEKKRLIKVTSSYNSYWKISYDGNKYARIDAYDAQDKPLVTYKFTYDKSKISKVELTDLGGGKGEQGRFLETIFPQEIIKNSAKKDKGAKSNANVITFTFTYDKDNIKEMIEEYIDGAHIERYTTTFLKYDKKSNPYYNFTDPNFGGINKNNPLEVEAVYTETGYDSERHVTTYEYTYDGKVPTEVRMVSRWVGSDYDPYRWTKFYEYK